MKANSEMLRKKRARLAAALAMSNLGHMVPGHAASNPQNWSTDPRIEMENLAGHLSESEEHDRIYAQEAMMWYTYVSTHSRVYLLSTHRDAWVSDIIHADVVPTPKPKGSSR